MSIKACFFGFLVGLSTLVSAEDYTTWGYYKPIVIDTRNQAGGARVTNAQTDFPVLVRLNATNANDIFTGALANGFDIRFARGTTHLVYQRERWDVTNKLAEFWVRVPNVKGNDTTTLQIYWSKTGAPDSSSGTAVFNRDNSFRAVWHLGESSTPSADATPSNLEAKWQNSPASVDGMIGKAVNLANGSGQGATGLNGKYLTATNVNGGLDMNSTDGVTLSFWMRRTGTNTSNTNPVQCMAGRYTYSNGSNRQYALVTNNAGLISLFYSLDGGADATLSSTVTATNNTWYHVAATLTANSRIIYINGTQRATNSATGMTSLDQVWPDAFTIGKMDSSAPYDQYFNGTMDEVELAGRAQSADWIKLSYQTQRTDSSFVLLGATAAIAPYNLSYAPNPAVYTVGYAIPASTPRVSGSVASYSISPALSAGLSFDTQTGVISGTPTATASATTYTITATNAGGSATAQLSIAVNGSLVAPTGLSYSSSPAIYGLNTAITANSPTVTGTVTSYSISPALPAGLTMSTSTGVISGTPTAVSPATNYIVTAGNSAGSTTATVNITVLAPPTGLSYSTPTANYPRGIAITANNPTVTGTVATYAVNPALPAGLSLNATTGVISGTPTSTVATKTYTVTATNAAGSATVTISITVYGAPSGLFYNANPATYTQGQTIAANTPTVTGTVTRWSITPVLPAGLAFDTLTGIISGTPTASTPSYSDFTITATNAVGSTTAILTLWVISSSSIEAQIRNLHGIDINGLSSITIRLPNGIGPVLVSVLNVHGRSVWSRHVKSGATQVSWDGHSEGGFPVPGVYFVQVISDGTGKPEVLAASKIILSL